MKTESIAICRNHELGGRIITIGSDAHKSENVGAYIEVAIDIITKAGFQEVTLFKNREPGGGEKKVEYLVIPFGRVKILIDDIEILYCAVKKQPNERYCPDIVGRYHISVDCIPDGKEHEIKCIIENILYSDRGPESGEMLE